MHTTHDDLITRVIHKILPIIYIISDDILHMHDTCVKAPPTIQIFANFINLCCLLHSLIIYVFEGAENGKGLGGSVGAVNRTSVYTNMHKE